MTDNPESNDQHAIEDVPSPELYAATLVNALYDLKRFSNNVLWLFQESLKLDKPMMLRLAELVVESHKHSHDVRDLDRCLNPMCNNVKYLIQLTKALKNEDSSS